MRNPWLLDEPMKEEAKQLLEHLKEHGGLEVEEAPGEWGHPGDVFDMAARWLARGEPVYFENIEHRWLSFYESENLTLHYARSAEELEFFRETILLHKELVVLMLQGLDRRSVCGPRPGRETGWRRDRRCHPHPALPGFPTRCRFHWLPRGSSFFLQASCRRYCQ